MQETHKTKATTTTTTLKKRKKTTIKERFDETLPIDRFL